MREQIMKAIVLRGGLYGLAAKAYINDVEKSNQFIIECFEQCHNQSTHELWGKGLVKEIILYRLDLAKELRTRLIEVNSKLRVRSISNS